MCGIAGIYYKNDKKHANTQEIIQSVTDAMTHRGPDSSGFYFDGKIGLGHRRLAIIDLSEGGKQPMHDVSNRFVISFNGEIFNYQSLKNQLRDYPFRSQSDTEVILAAYQKWGQDCPKYLKGQFAFAIWDKQEEKLFMARDRMGEKPIYYYNDPDIFIFASELSALVKSRLVPTRLSKPALADYLKYQSVNFPYTLLENVFQIPPACSAMIHKQDVHLKNYWNICSTNPNEDYGDYALVKKKVKTLLQEAVAGQMISDVPLGAFLSGGIDSSALVALMAEASEKPIHTFSITYDDKNFDESQYSDIVVKKYGTIHNVIKLHPTDLLKAMPDALNQMDAPSGDGINTYIIAKEAKKRGITVAISGLGGDELFAGYPNFANYRRIQENNWLLTMPRPLRALAGKSLYYLKPNIATEKIAALLAAQDFSPNQFYTLTRRIYAQNEIKQIAPQLPAETDFLNENILSLKDAIAQLPLLSQYSVCEMIGYTNNVLLKDSDAMSLGHSLEVRVPFFDHDLFSYVLGIPDSLKQAKNVPKKVLVESLGDLLPSEIVYRRKMGFLFPWESWLKNEIAPFCRESIYALGQRDIFDKQALHQFYERFHKGDKSVRWLQIWLLVVLESWLKKIEV
jgi:asparagine synthase (glutamine-hydrolysing)